jgi:glycosyltransferase involved in cell wall biosynthesis
LPSSWPEGLPYAMLEAAAYGAALIGTNVGSVDKILFNEVNGFFIEPGNVNMLKDVIQKFLDNPKLAKEMGKESYRICKNLFSIEHLRKIYADLFVRLEFEINDNFRCTSH